MTDIMIHVEPDGPIPGDYSMVCGRPRSHVGLAPAMGFRLKQVARLPGVVVNGRSTAR
jgi:hypothetical protein